VRRSIMARILAAMQGRTGEGKRESGQEMTAGGGGR
jgi:hypothetical protein